MTHWTPWYRHDGKGLPDHVRGQLVQAVGETLSGRIISGQGPADAIPLENWDWGLFGHPIVWASGDIVKSARILRYRIRRSPEAEKLISSIRETEDA